MFSKRFLKKTALCIVIIAVGSLSIITYSKQNHKQTQIVMANENSIETENVSRQNIKSVITSTGTVAVQKTYSINLSTMQKISKVLVDVGDMVTEGQTLIEYDYLSSKESLDKDLEEANINLKNAQLSLQSYNVTKTDSEIADLQNAIVVAEKNLYQAELDLINHNNNIEEAKKSIETAKSDIEYAQIEIDNSQKGIDNAQKDLDSNKQLLDIGAISQNDYNSFETAYNNKVTEYNNTLRAYENKQIAYDDAVNNLTTLETKTKTYEYAIETAKYNLESAQRNLEEAKNPTMTNDEKIKYEQQKLQIESCQIKIDNILAEIEDIVDISASPINGTIIEKNVEDGDIAQESTALLKVANINDLKVTATVSEYDASSIKLGQKVTMTSDGIRDKTYTGEIIFINPQAVTSGDENVVTIDVSLDNADESLKPGFTIDLEIVTGEAENALVVPVASILSDEQGQNYVFTVDENKLKKSIIITGVYGDMYVEIIDGLDENVSVVSSPTTLMREGQSVDSSNATEDKQNKNNDMQMPMRGGNGGPPAGGRGAR